MLETVGDRIHLAEILVAIPLGAFFLYVTLKHSPPVLRCYRNNLLNITFGYSATVLTFGVVGPAGAFVDERKSQVCLRVASPFSQENVVMAYVMMIVWGSSMTILFIALMVASFYKYITLAHPKLCVWMRSRKGVLACVLAELAFISMNSTIASIFTYFIDKEYVDETLLLCFDMQVGAVAHADFMFLIIMIFCFFAILFTLLLLSIRSLSKQRSIMSHRTYRLQLMLIVNLIILTVIPVCCEIIPVFAILFALYFKWPCVEKLYTITTYLPCVDLILIWAVSLGFVTPYRSFVLGKLNSFWNSKRGIGVVGTVAELTSNQLSVS